MHMELDPGYIYWWVSMCMQMQGTDLDRDWYAVWAFLFSTQDLVEQELGDVLWIHQELKK